MLLFALHSDGGISSGNFTSYPTLGRIVHPETKESYSILALTFFLRRLKQREIFTWTMDTPLTTRMAPTFTWSFHSVADEWWRSKITFLVYFSTSHYNSTWKQRTLGHLAHVSLAKMCCILYWYFLVILKQGSFPPRRNASKPIPLQPQTEESGILSSMWNFLLVDLFLLFLFEYILHLDGGFWCIFVTKLNVYLNILELGEIRSKPPACFTSVRCRCLSSTIDSGILGLKTRLFPSDFDLLFSSLLLLLLLL